MWSPTDHGGIHLCLHQCALGPLSGFSVCLFRWDGLIGGGILDCEVKNHTGVWICTDGQVQRFWRSEWCCVWEA